MSDEQVLVIPKAVAFRNGVRSGFTSDPALAKTLIESTTEQMFRPRSEVENQPHWLQLIPYCLLVNAAGNVFAYERGGSGGEDRLHRKISIGIGGHINPVDAWGNGCKYSAGLYREIVEEVDIDPEFSIGDPIGLAYDDSNDVGRVHLGIVHIVYVGDSTITPLEDSIDSPMMLSAGSLSGRRDRMEVWSKLCVDYLLGAFTNVEQPECEACQGDGKVPETVEHTVDRGTRWQRTDRETIAVECPLCEGKGTVS